MIEKGQIGAKFQPNLTHDNVRSHSRDVGTPDATAPSRALVTSALGRKRASDGKPSHRVEFQETLYYVEQVRVPVLRPRDVVITDNLRLSPSPEGISRFAVSPYTSPQ
jgi:hypothetical protein